jgi:predicted flap endonuclease-1-like 5' DNA nuclease
MEAPDAADPGNHPAVSAGFRRRPYGGPVDLEAQGGPAMIALIAYYGYWLFAAFLIGLATAWWTWAREPVADLDDWDDIAPYTPVRQNPPAQASPPPPVQPPPAPPASEPAPAPAPARAEGDELTRIKGIDSQMGGMLNLLGVRQYGEIASWTEEEIEQIAVLLGTKPDRIAEDGWIEQARLLAAGDGVEFEQRFG